MSPRLVLPLLLIACSSRFDPVDDEPEPAAEPIPLDFVDVSRARLGQQRPAERFAPVVLDVDGDGHVDLLEIDPTGLWLSASVDGELFFAARRIVDLPDPVGAVLVRDGGADALLVFGSPEGDRIVRSPGTSSDPEVRALPSRVHAAVTGDVDDDGIDDVVAFGIADLTVEAPEPGLLVFRGTADGLLPAIPLRWAPGGPVRADALALGDVDGDGAVDLAVAAEDAVPLVLLGDGAGAFLRAPPETVVVPPGVGRHVALVDLTGDGVRDLLLAGSGPVRLLRNADGRFDDISELVLPQRDLDVRALAAVDLDGDGPPELVIARADGPLSLLRADAQGRFFDYSDVITGLPASVGATGLLVDDLDADGDPDLYVTLDDLRRARLWRNWHPRDLPDGDGDRVPDALDVCPDIFDPDQGDRDYEPFACSGRADCERRTGCALHWIEGDAYLRCQAPLTAAQATARCAARGAALLVPESAEQTELLGQRGILAGWVGLTDAEVEGRFVDADGVEPEFSPWAEGEPNDAGGGEDCVQVRGDGLWNDLPCEATLPFTCSAPPPYAVSDPGDACDVCPDILDPDQLDSTGDGRGDACSDA